MSQDQFQILYDGSEIRQGAMDVYDLAPALISVGDLLREANRFLNEDRATVALQVRSDFHRGSFEIFLNVDQTIVEHVNHALFAADVIDAKQLIHLIFGDSPSLIAGTTSLTTAVLGLVKLYKLLKGRKPEKAPAANMEDNSVTLIQNIHVEAKTAQLYMNDAIRSHVDRVLRPLAKEGIDVLEVRREKEVIDRLEKSDLPERVFQFSREDNRTEVLSDTREALLKVIKVDFENGKWRFSDGSAKFAATLDDATFQKKLDNREIGFYKGDVLRVILRTDQMAHADGKLKTEYAIEKVIEHQPQARQQNLLPPKRIRKFKLNEKDI